MIQTLKSKKMTWINLLAPTAKEVDDVRKKFKIHPLIAGELSKPTLRSRVDVYDKVLYLILHFPIFDQKKRSSVPSEIDFVIGKNFIITAHYKTIDPFDNLIKVCNLDSGIRNECLGEHSGHLLFSILKRLYNFSLRELDHIDQKITKIEDEIFDGNEKDMVKELSILGRDVLDFRRTIQPQETVLSSLEHAGIKFFPKSFDPYLAYIYGEYYRVWNLLENHKETIEALQSTNESLLSTKTNETMKILTIMAFITFPLSLIAGIFGMNAHEMPIVGGAGDFWIIMGIMAVATFFMFMFFRFLKWI